MMKKNKTNIRTIFQNENGFSLIELTVVIVVTSVFTLTTLPFFKVNINSYLQVKSGKNMIQSARIGFNRMMNEMKQIESSIVVNQAFTHGINFDLPGEPGIDYTFSYGSIKRNNVKLIENVQNFELRYYSADGTEKATPFYYDSDLWRIHIEITVGESGSYLVLRGQVSPRNIHYD